MTPSEHSGICRDDDVAMAVYDELKEQITFLVEALEQYAMIASPMGEIARTALAVYQLPIREQRREMSKAAIKKATD